ncbi:MAG TPA: ComF family protein [Jatrophihabitantaceae bacterium]|nr:ComF family protein [Jatrophihabitantaceae bacterium]
MIRALADLVLPRRCAGCGTPGELLCATCRPSGPPIAVPGLGGPVFAAGRYERGLRAALLAYKERGRRELAEPFAALLAATAAGLSIVGGALVPVPSARAAARRRGGDHVLRLARHTGARLGVATVPALRLARPVHDSAGLGVDERRANLAGAMAAGPPPRDGLAAVLVDDIVTTGATVQEALRALQGAGWAVSGVLTLAITPLRRSREERGSDSGG